jgi:CRISPR-associated protein Cas2
MQTYVVYDIVEDKVRKRIADVCLDYGLQRVQYSAFLGDLSRDRREALAQRLAQRLGKQEGKIEVIPVCDKDFAQRRVIAVGP